MDTQAKWDTYFSSTLVPSATHKEMEGLEMRTTFPHTCNPRKSLRVNTSLVLSVSFFSPFSVGYTRYPRFPIPSTLCGVFCHDFSIPVYTFPGLITYKTAIIHYLPPYFNTVGVVLGQDSVGMFLRLDS